MKVSIAQIDIAYGNVSKNYERTAKSLQKSLDDHPDVIVLPEMWNTGLRWINLTIWQTKTASGQRISFLHLPKNMTSISSEAHVPSNAKANSGTLLMILTEKDN